MKKYLCIMMLMIFGALYGGSFTSHAEQRDYSITNYSVQTIQMKTGDTGRLIPIADSAENPIVTMSFTTWNQDTLLVSNDGTYTALKSSDESVTVRGYDSMGYEIFYANVRVEIYPDLTNAALSSTSGKIYLFSSLSEWGMYYYGANQSLEVDVLCNEVLDSVNGNVSMQYTSSNQSMGVSCVMTGNKIEISAWTAGKTTITITLNDKTFTYNLVVKKVSISTDSVLLSKGKTKKLKVKGADHEVKWSSGNRKIATVSKSGVVKAKKTGNVVITAKVEGGYIGCVVSVVSPQLKKVVTYAKKIGKTWKYSQPKRMQKGYYDCSSLVWRSYAKYGKKVASKTYAPVAADMGKWCVSKKKRIKGGLSYKNITKMKLRPGDLIFETGWPNGRYKGIYHVEMFAGYAVRGYNDGKPIIVHLWANRPAGYYGPSGQLMGRP